MSRVECVREQEILDAITAGRWPNRLSEDLSAHVAECTICADLGIVAESFGADYQEALKNVRVPSAGLVWWRAEIRARQDAVRTVNRPIRWAQYIAAACSLAAVVIFLSLVDFPWAGFNFSSIIGHYLPVPIVYVTLGAIAVVLSVAAYFVLFDD